MRFGDRQGMNMRTLDFAISAMLLLKLLCMEATWEFTEHNTLIEEFLS